MDDAPLESAGPTLQLIGRDLLQSIIALCVESAVWAIYLILVIISSVILLRKRRSRMACFLLGVVVLMLALDTAMYVIDVSNAVREISFTLTSESTLSLPARYARTASLPWPVQSALYAFLSNLGDVIIIWRVYAFYSIGRERLVVLLPFALLMGSFATSGIISFCAVHHFLTDRTIVAGNFVDPPLCKNVQFTSYCLALVTTGVATLVIWFKTWQYRRTISSLLWRVKTRKSKIERTLTLLVESGILYFLFFLSAVITDTPRVVKLEESSAASSLASRVWTYLTSHIICIYPVLVIIIVHSQRSYIDATTTRELAVFVADTVDSELGVLGGGGAASIPAFNVPSATSSRVDGKELEAQGERASLERSSSYHGEEKGGGDV